MFQGQRKSFIKLPTFLKLLFFRELHTSQWMHTRRIPQRVKNLVVLNDSPEVHAHENDIPIQSKNINENFYGLESEHGVINVEQKSLQSRKSLDALDEKYRRLAQDNVVPARFGTVRFDSENKIRFHGQQDKDISEDFRGIKKGDDYYKIPSKYMKQLSAKSKVRSDSSVNRRISSEHMFETSLSSRQNQLREENNDKAPSLSVIDQCYFEDYFVEGKLKENSDENTGVQATKDIGQTSITEHIFEVKSNKNLVQECPIPDGTKDLGFFDSSYFQNSLLEKTFDEPMSEETESLSYIDECYFKAEDVSSLQQNIVDSAEKKASLDCKINKTDEPHFPEKSNDVSSFSADCTEEQNDASLFDELYFKNLTEESVHKQSIDNPIHVRKLENDTSEILTVQHESNDHTYPKKDKIISNRLIERSPVKTKELNENKFCEERLASDSSLSQPHDPIEKAMFSNLFEFKNKDTSTYESSTKYSDSKISDLNTSRNLQVKSDTEKGSSENTMSTAYDFVKNFREENKISHLKDKIPLFTEKLDSKGFRVLKHQVPNLKFYTRDEILELLEKSVLYSDDDVLVLNKPYNLVMHESQTTKDACLSQYLEEFARRLDKTGSSPKLYTVHRLDKETTGCLLLARNEITAARLKSLFAQRKIIKTYWILTTKIPDPFEGVIDIPISEGSVDKRTRMVLHPELPKDVPYQNHSKWGRRAVTNYKVISVSGSSALVEVKPETGIKHQIRVHFGFGLSCPILGDHKYSHLKKLAPQKLASDLLQRLQVRQSKVRYIPMHIYARSILIPQYADGRNLFVQSPMPHHMAHNLRRLKFKKG